MRGHIDGKATLALLGAVVSWSLGPLFLKYFTPYIDAWTTNGLRYSTAALVYLAYFLFWRKQGFPSSKLWKMTIVPVIVNVLGQILWALTPYYIDPGLMAFLVRLSTLWAVIGSFFLFHDERRAIATPLFWIGFFLSVAGFIGLVLGGSHSFSGATAVGITLIFLCSLFWAGYQISIRRYLSKIDAPTAFGLVSILTALCLFLLMFPTGNPEASLRMPLHVSLLVVLSALISIAVAHVLFYYAIRHLGVAISSSTNLGGAFITALLSRFLFQETMTGLQWASGLLLILGGIMLIRTQMYLNHRKQNTEESE